MKDTPKFAQWHPHYLMLIRTLTHHLGVRNRIYPCLAGNFSVCANFYIMANIEGNHI